MKRPTLDTEVLQAAAEDDQGCQEIGTDLLSVGPSAGFSIAHFHLNSPVLCHRDPDIVHEMLNNLMFKKLSTKHSWLRLFIQNHSTS